MIPGVVAGQVIAATPSILSTSIEEYGLGYRVYWYVRNNDAETASVYSNAGTTPPTGNVKSLASGATSTQIYADIMSSSVTIYAQAKVTGKFDSAIDSVLVSM